MKRACKNYCAIINDYNASSIWLLKRNYKQMKMYRLIFGITMFVYLAVSISAQTLPAGDEIVKNVNARDEGKHLIQDLTMTLINKSGKKQERATRSYRKDYKDQRKTILVYLSPTNVKGTGFMSYDYNNIDDDDDQWLYLPALRKTRRISAANRGDYFLGTDFTYEDIKLGTKMSTTDYTYKTLKEEAIDGVDCYLLEATPVNEDIARELGYKKVHFWVDNKIWMVKQVKYWDIAGNLLKTTHIKDVKKFRVSGLSKLLKL